MTGKGCAHCGLPVIGDDRFCCKGCERVFQLLNDNGLAQFYQIKDESPELGSPRAAEGSGRQYEYLDSETVLAEYGKDNGLRLDFCIEGIHCHACVWLIEKVPELISGIESLRVNVGAGTVSILRNEGGSFAKAATLLDELGYRVHLYQEDHQHALQAVQLRSSLMRIGVSAAAAANIMIFSISIYAGLDGGLKQVFDWISAALMVPVIGYSAAPFFRSAFASLRMRTLSIDLPIALALVLGVSMSLFNLIHRAGDLYFDSLAMFVFLILSVRHLFMSAYQKLDIQKSLSAAILPMEARRVMTGSTEQVPVSDLVAEDTIRVETGAIIPVDGAILSLGYIDVQLLTGESVPVKKGPGDEVLAGMRNMGEPIEIRVQKIAADTRLGQLIHTVNNNEAPHLVNVADRVAHYLLWISLSLALGLLGYYGYIGQIHYGFQSALALIVLACPCALSLATPLAYSISINRAAKQGICIQSPTALDLLCRVEQIFFDKTGTLTKGEMSVTEIRSELDDRDWLYNLLYSLELKSAHPLASAIRRYALEQGVRHDLGLDEYSEEIGVGVSGVLNSKRYELKASGQAQDGILSSLGLFEDGVMIAEVLIADTVLPEAIQVTQQLKSDYRLGILSGDQGSCVAAVASELGIDDARGGLSPEDKVVAIAAETGVLMIGDGANDTQALMAADVSIAVQGSFESSLKAADVYLLSKQFLNVKTVLDLAAHTQRVVQLNFVAALGYNSLGIVLVLLGYIHPLIAALVMPLSSLTVILHSYLRLRD